MEYFVVRSTILNFLRSKTIGADDGVQDSLSVKFFSQVDRQTGMYSTLVDTLMLFEVLKARKLFLLNRRFVGQMGLAPEVGSTSCNFDARFEPGWDSNLVSASGSRAVASLRGCTVYRAKFEPRYQALVVTSSWIQGLSIIRTIQQQQQQQQQI
jgi:hypothetical protein